MNGRFRALRRRLEVFSAMIEHDNHFSSPNTHHRWLIVLGALVLAVGAYAIYLGTQSLDLKRQFTAVQRDNATLRAKLSDTDTELQAALNSLRQDLSQAQEDASASVAKAASAASAATRHADTLASQLSKKTAEQAEALSAELGKVKESTVDASSKIDGITSDVGSVKTDVASTKSALDETRSDLQRTRGDLGVMSGLLATNSKGIQELRDRGDRNIYEFTLAKNGSPQKVGDIELILRKADTGHSRFTLDVLADDKRVEKKDRTINEPVQFYTSKARQPYEIVVNQVGKNQIVGYLATPKVTISRNESAKQ
jgi:predicted  nucleic acid-binding Zn-ribbon protein